MDAVPSDDHPTETSGDRPTDPAPPSYPAAAEERCSACAGSGLCSNCSGLGRRQGGGLCVACNGGDCAVCDGVGWRVAAADGGSAAPPLTLGQRLDREEQERQRLSEERQRLSEELERVGAELRASEQRLTDLRAERDAAPPPAACEGCRGSGVCLRCGWDAIIFAGRRIPGNAEVVGAAAGQSICGCVAGRCRDCGGSGASAAAPSTGAP
ncbi:hypothetical protein [Sorangium sp. So ce128]|uniref:hypothetical protein n=1 Tax=Sorangium sp. So ce128 TaxID=3133281 RepID=UPI003F5E6269